MKKKRTYILLIIVLLLSFISTACKSEEEMFVEEAINHMRQSMELTLVMHICMMEIKL